MSGRRSWLARRHRQPVDAEPRSERPFFFFHIMKTAGTTFAARIQEIFGADHVYPQILDAPGTDANQAYTRVDALLSLTPEQRAGIRVYAGHFPFVAYELLGIDAITLTILRDPVDRTVSMLKHCKREIEMFRDMELDEIYERRLVHEAFVDNFQTKQFAFTRADAPESCLTALAIDDDRLRIAITNLDSVDVVGVTERFDAFLDELRRRFGWQFASSADRNVSREGWSVSTNLRRRIAEDNRFDIEFFEHAKRRTGL